MGLPKTWYVDHSFGSITVEFVVNLSNITVIIHRCVLIR